MSAFDETILSKALVYFRVIAQTINQSPVVVEFIVSRLTTLLIRRRDFETIVAT